MVTNSNRSNSTLARYACAIAFILFTFSYLYYFQADLLFMEQHVLSNGMTHYDRTIGAVLILVLLVLLQVCVSRLVRFRGASHALTYFPSLLLLALLTSGGADFDTQHFATSHILLTVLLLVAFAIFAISYRSGAQSANNVASSDGVQGELWKSLGLMLVMFFLVCTMANTDEVFHYRLRAESCIRSKDYEKALRVGEKSADTDASLTMFRVFALSRSKQLGERLFEYPLPTGGSKLLLPDGKDIKCMSFSASEIIKQLSIRQKGRIAAMDYLLYIERQDLALKSATDYILCGFLLDKNIDAFAHEITKRYNVESPSLPKHYKEALTLYTHLRANPVVVCHNEVADADYADFQKLKAENNSKDFVTNVRDSYGQTYWYYYFYR